MSGSVWYSPTLAEARPGVLLLSSSLLLRSRIIGGLGDGVGKVYQIVCQSLCRRYPTRHRKGMLTTRRLTRSVEGTSRKILSLFKVRLLADARGVVGFLGLMLDGLRCILTDSSELVGRIVGTCLSLFQVGLLAETSGVVRLAGLMLDGLLHILADAGELVACICGTCLVGVT
jgi:hypothetical protein